MFYYLLIIFLFIIISDILETPLESLNKFLLIIIFSLLLVYAVGYILEHFFKNKFFIMKLIYIYLVALVIGIITIIVIYLTYRNADNKNDLYNSFNYALYKNILFLMYFTFYLFIYYIFYYFFDWNNSLTDILCPAILGGLLIFFVFSIIIFIAIKIKLIKRNDVLNTFIVLISISIFLGLVYGYIFMSSLSTICTTNANVEQINQEENMAILMIISTLIILWYDDVRNWHQFGSILFVFATIIAFYSTFYYSISHPNVSFFSTWLFIEWLIIIFYRKENSKNSIHFSFMDT
jgi:hypothetical protein